MLSLLWATLPPVSSHTVDALVVVCFAHGRAIFYRRSSAQSCAG